MDDLGDDALQVAVALAEVEAPEASWALAVVGVGLEDRARTLTLSANDTTHCVREGDDEAGDEAAEGKWRCEIRKFSSRV